MTDWSDVSASMFTWKKWTLKFKLLYLLNYISYFNKICTMCCVNILVQSLKVWLKSVLLLLKYIIFFPRGLFYWRALYIAPHLTSFRPNWLTGWVSCDWSRSRRIGSCAVKRSNSPWLRPITGHFGWNEVTRDECYDAPLGCTNFSLHRLPIVCHGCIRGHSSLTVQFSCIQL